MFKICCLRAPSPATVYEPHVEGQLAALTVVNERVMLTVLKVATQQNASAIKANLVV